MVILIAVVAHFVEIARVLPRVSRAECCYPSSTLYPGSVFECPLLTLSRGQFRDRACRRRCARMDTIAVVSAPRFGGLNPPSRTGAELQTAHWDGPRHFSAL
jgi:hypothetical protein